MDLSVNLSNSFKNESILMLPTETISTILFLGIEPNINNKKNTSYKKASSKSSIVKNYKIVSKALHPAIENLFHSVVKLSYKDEPSLITKLALVKSNRQRLDANIFYAEEIKEFSEDLCQKFFKLILKQNNEQAFELLLNNKNFKPNIFAYYWLLSLNKKEKANKFFRTITEKQILIIWKIVSSKGYTQIFKYFLDVIKYDPTTCNNYAIIFAAKGGHTEIVKALLKDKRVNPSADQNQALRFAAEGGHIEIVIALLKDKRTDPNAYQSEALRSAAEYGHVKVVIELLKDKRTNPCSFDNSAIRWAAQYGRTEVVKVLLADKRVDPSANKNEAIFLAAENGHLEVIKVLLRDKRVDPNEALLKAKECNRPQIVEFLLLDTRITQKTKKQLVKAKADQAEVQVVDSIDFVLL